MHDARGFTSKLAGRSCRRQRLSCECERTRHGGQYGHGGCWGIISIVYDIRINESHQALTIRLSARPARFSHTLKQWCSVTLSTNRMTYNCALIVASLLPWKAFGITWPVLVQTDTTTCQLVLPNGTCGSITVPLGIQMLTAPPPTVPNPISTAGESTLWRVTGAVVRCRYGAPTGPWSGCQFYTATALSPPLSGCDLKSTPQDGTWVFKNPGACRVIGPAHGTDDYPTVCTVVGLNRIGLDYTTLMTPWGLLDATATANGGGASGYCMRVTPPNETCTVGTMVVMDHGTLAAGASSERTQEIPVNCGARPRVQVAGPTDFDIGGGAHVSVDAVATGRDSIRVTTKVNATGAEPGSYEGHSVIVVTPE